MGSAIPSFASKPKDLNSRIAKLTDLVTNGSSFKVRTYAAQKLGKLRNQGGRNHPAIVSSLQRGLRDSHHLVRSACAKALGRHRSKRALAALETARSKDTDPYVRQTARWAIQRIKNEKKKKKKKKKRKGKRFRRLKVEIGRVEMSRSKASKRVQARLTSLVRNAAEDQIEPHKPAIFPRESADYRLNITLRRKITKKRKKRDIQIEAKVVSLELPRANLRHVTSAIATLTAKRSSRKTLANLEERVALKATQRAVNEAIELLARDAGVLANRF